MGYTVGTRKIRRRKLNPRVRHRRRRHSNPRFSIAGIQHQLVPAAWGAVGGIGLDITLGYVQPYLPAMLQTGYAKHAARIGVALGVGFVARKFLRGRGSAVAAGALTLAVYGLLKDVMVQFLPGVKGLGAYEEIVLDDTGSLGAYLPGTGTYLPDGSRSTVQPGMGAYLSGMHAHEGEMLNGLDF